MMKEITVVVEDGRVVAVYATQNAKEVLINIIDKDTDDAEAQDEIQEQLDMLDEAVNDGTLTEIY